MNECWLTEVIIDKYILEPVEDGSSKYLHPYSFKIPVPCNSFCITIFDLIRKVEMLLRSWPRYRLPVSAVV